MIAGYLMTAHFAGGRLARYRPPWFRFCSFPARAGVRARWSVSPRTTVQSSRRRSVDFRRCVPSYHAEWTSLRRYRRSSSASRRSGSFLKRHWHRDGDAQPANGSLGAAVARIFRPASSCTAAQHSRAATIVTAEYLAGPMARPVFSGGRAKSVIQIGKTQSASTSRTCRRGAKALEKQEEVGGEGENRTPDLGVMNPSL